LCSAMTWAVENALPVCGMMAAKYRLLSVSWCDCREAGLACQYKEARHAITGVETSSHVRQTPPWCRPSFEATVDDDPRSPGISCADVDG
jgi:hypothetical protein